MKVLQKKTRARLRVAIDAKKMRELETFRVEHAPAPFVPSSAPLPPNSVVSVLLGAGESVEWTWTTDANGARYVTGYTIIEPRLESGKEHRMT